MKLSDQDHAEKTVIFEIVAKSGDVPYISCMPALLLTKQLLDEEINNVYACPYVGFITRDTYFNASSEMDITWNSHSDTLY